MNCNPLFCDLFLCAVCLGGGYRSVLEECHTYGTGTGMSTDDAADGRVAHLICIAFLQMPAVLDVFQKHRIGQAGISE